MDQYITVTSGESPSRFTSRFNSVISLSYGYEIALKSIYHGPIFNVTEKNDSFTITKGDRTVNFQIPHGFYDRSCEILRAAWKTIQKTFDDGTNEDGLNLKKPPSFTIDPTGMVILKLSQPSENFSFSESSPLFEILGCFTETPDKTKIEINDYPLETTVECGFLYSDVVKNSIINNSFARLMTCVPLHSKKGYSFFEFQNPDYKPLSVNSFTDLSFVIADQNGQDIEFDQSSGCGATCKTNVEYPTILNLHIRRS